MKFVCQSYKYYPKILFIEFNKLEFSLIQKLEERNVSALYT